MRNWYRVLFVLAAHLLMLGMPLHGLYGSGIRKETFWGRLGWGAAGGEVEGLSL